MNEGEQNQPTPEEAKPVIYHTVNFEFVDKRIQKAQQNRVEELHDIFRLRYREEPWVSIHLDHRHEEDRTVTTFCFITDALDPTTPNSLSLQRATEHLFDWLLDSGIPDADVLYTGIRASVPGQHSKTSFKDFTIETNAAFKRLAEIHNEFIKMSPSDFIWPET